MDNKFIVDGNKLIKYIGSDEKVIIPNEIKVISNSSFRLSTVIEVILPNTIDKIGEGAFELCFNLKKINILYSVKYLGPGCFCESSLEEVIINGSNTILDGCFLDCHMLRCVKLPSYAIIKSDTFAYCDYLKDITIPDTTKLIEEDAFYECKNLNVTVSYNLIKKFGINVFKGCKSITTNINDKRINCNYLDLIRY